MFLKKKKKYFNNQINAIKEEKYTKTRDLVIVDILVVMLQMIGAFKMK